MKALLKLILLTTALLGAPLPAAEIGTVYGGIQYAIVNFDPEGFGDADPTALVGKLGRFVTEHVAIEGRFGIGLQDDEIEVDLGIFGSVDIDVEVERLYGFYLVLHSDTSADSSFYGVLGVTDGELEFEDEVSEDESGLSFGVGANFGRLNVEYMSYLDEDDFEATAIAIGYVSRFD